MKGAKELVNLPCPPAPETTYFLENNNVISNVRSKATDWQVVAISLVKESGVKVNVCRLSNRFSLPLACGSRQQRLRCVSLSRQTVKTDDCCGECNEKCTNVTTETGREKCVKYSSVHDFTIVLD